MDSKATQRITDNTSSIIEFADLPDRIRTIAKLLEKNTKGQKDLLAIANFLEGDARDLLNPLYVGAIAILKLLCTASFMSYEEIGAKSGKSKATAQQTINALKKGGLDLQESPARGYRAATGRPRIGKHL